MKKVLVFIIAALVSFAAGAQPRAFGGRLGTGAEVSYQHYLGRNFAEIDLGFNLSSGLGVTAIYDFICASPKWTRKGTWEVYAGPGLSLGTYLSQAPFSFGICGQVGLAFTFWFPLQLSADLRPAIGFATSDGRILFNVDGVIGLVPTIGVRYSFGN